MGQSKEAWRPQLKRDGAEIGLAREGQKVKDRMGQSRIPTLLAKWFTNSVGR